MAIDIRRHHRQRMRRRAARIAKEIWHSDYMAKNAQKYADNLKFCSCPICGNPRRYFNLKTIQEIKIEEAEKEDMI